MMSYCPSCGDLRDEAWRFCRGCGAERFPTPEASGRAFCTRCGELMGRDWKHCRACGLLAPSPSAATSAPLPRTAFPPTQPDPDPEVSPYTQTPPRPVAPPDAPEATSPPLEVPSVKITPSADRPSPKPRADHAVEEAIRRRFAAAASQVERAEPIPVEAPPKPVQFELIAVPDLPVDEEPEPDEPMTESAVDPFSTATDESTLAARDELPPLPAIPGFASFPQLDVQPRVELISPQSEIVDIEAGPYRDAISDARPWQDSLDTETDVDDPLDDADSRIEDMALVVDHETVLVDDEVVEQPDVDDAVDGAERADDVFRPLEGVAAAIQIVWLVAGTTAVALTAALVMLNLRLEEFRRSGDFGPVERLSGTIDTVLTSSVIVAVIVALAATAWWTVLATANRQAAEGVEPRFGTRQIILGWLVPGVNLVAPPVLITQVWRGAKGKANLWIIVWWVTLIGFGAGLLWITRLPSASVEDSLDANAYAAMTYGLLIAACLAAVGMVSSVSARQREMAVDFDERLMDLLTRS